MNFLLLPSHRVALIKSLSNSIKIVPFKAQQLIHNPISNKKQSFVSLHYKTLSLYNYQKLQEPIYSSTFPKKINSVSFNPYLEKSTILVSDKFGDIYQVNSQNPTYLNSNLGIPSFLHCFQNYLILGDELSKIKIYNLKEPHEIFSIWYIIKSQPLDLKQFGKDKFLLLSKFQDKELLKERQEIFCFRGNQLQNQQFPGVKIFGGQTSDYSKSNEIKSSCIVSISQTSFVYIIIKKQYLHITQFTLKNQQKLEFQQKTTNSFKLSLKQSSLDHLSAIFDVQSKRVLISVGKQVQIEEQIKDIQQFSSKNQFQEIKLNDSQLIVVYHLN